MKPAPLSSRANGWLVAAIYAWLVCAPLLFLVVQASAAAYGRTNEWVGLAMPNDRLQLLVRSVWLAGLVSLTCTTLGVLAATALGRRSGWLSRLRWLAVVLAPVPVYIQALAWGTTVFSGNSWLRSHGLPEIPLRGYASAWWVQSMGLAPLGVVMAMLALDLVPEELLEAARLQAGETRVLFTIQLPLAAPLLLAGSGMVFLLGLLDYTVGSLMRVSVYSLAIYTEFSANHEPIRALMYSVPLAVVAVAALLATQLGLRQAVMAPVRRVASHAPATWPRWFRLLQGAALLTLGSQIILPLVIFAKEIPSSALFFQQLVAARDETVVSLWVACWTTLVGVVFALAVALRMVRPGKGQRAWWLAAVLPLAIPPPLMGIGLIGLYNQAWLPPVYGTSIMSVIASLARFLPLAAMVIAAQLRRTDPLLVDAARLFQRNARQGWLQVRLPMLLPGLMGAAALLFALSLGELGATLLVAPPGEQTLTMRIYSFLHSGASASVASLCVVMALLTVEAGAVAVLVMRGWGKLLPK